MTYPTLALFLVLRELTRRCFACGLRGGMVGAPGRRLCMQCAVKAAPPVQIHEFEED